MKRMTIPMAIGAALAGMAMVQTAAAAEAPLEEVVVTATKREKNVQDVPIAMTVLSGKEIEARNATTLTDVTAGSANVLYTEVNNSESSNSFNIRGLSTTFNNTGISPGVGVYVDGVYLARNAAFDSALNDLERIEILKGPQGTLFGKNTIQGVISVVTRDPTNEFEATTSAQIGNFGLWQLRGNIAGPLVEDKVSASFSAYTRKRDGFVEDTLRHTTLNGQDYYGGRAKVKFTPNENLKIVLSMDAQKDDTSANTEDSLPIDFDVTTSGQRQTFVRDIFGTSATINYAAGTYDITSITAYRSVDHQFYADQDYSAARILDLTTRKEDAHWISQELRIASPANEVFDWLAGVYLFKQKDTTDSYLEFGQDFFPFFTLFSDTFAKHRIDNQAVFVDANWHLSSRLTLNGGLRHDWDDQKFTYSQESNIFPVAGIVPEIAPFTKNLKSSELSATASVLFDLTDSMKAYAKYARGFKAAGFNTTLALASAAEITSVTPEFLDNYEIGLKGRFFDNRLSADFAAFYLDYKDRQVSVFISPIVGFAFANAAESTSWGLEAEFAARPTERLDLTFAVGYNEGKFDKFLNCLGPGTDCSHQPLGGPNINLSASIQYTQPVSSGVEVYGRVDGYWQEEPESNSISAAPELQLPDRTVVNARLALASPDQDWEVAAWVKNLTKDKFVIPGANFTGAITAQLPEPRTYGLEVTKRF